MPIDRTFIEKYDSFILTIRKILYFGDTNSRLQPVNPKHDRTRFINYFGYETNEEFYNSKNDSFDFANDDRLKDEFANTYCYKSLGIPELGDYCTIFSELTDEPKTAEEISLSRSLKNINRRLTNKEELVQSGSVISYGKGNRHYKRNLDPSTNFEDKDKLIEAIDFAIKKNNFSAFASTYKKLLVSRNDSESISCDIEIDHQLFHPILDEMHIWEIVSAITEAKKISIEYCNRYSDNDSIYQIDSVVPLKLVYDTLYGRTYLICHNSEKLITLRLDRIFHIDLTDSYNAEEYDEILRFINKKLETAWTVSIKDDLFHIVLRFNNTPMLKARIKNEGRHGKITKEDEQYFYFEIDVNDWTEMINWILVFGSQCKVLEPQPLVNKIIEHLEVMSK